MKALINMVSISGGKDSTATALLAKEQGKEFQMVFADTGNEHQLTYDYIDYLEEKLGPIKRLKSNFDAQIKHKREVVQVKWRNDGVPEETIERALAVLVPTGNPFLDLCIWKGRFPSTRRRFCSEQLKHVPLDEYAIKLLEEETLELLSWQGIRADESRSRALLEECEDHPKIDGLIWYRPILKWKAEDCFAIAKRHGLKPNPLYKMGMSRVGCMPCIHATKGEVFEIARRFPEELERLGEWEKIVSDASKRGASTFFDARVVQKHLGLPKITAANVNQVSPKTHGVTQYVSWSKTVHGGRQFDLMKEIEVNTEELVCKSHYGLCE